MTSESLWHIEYQHQKSRCEKKCLCGEEVTFRVVSSSITKVTGSGTGSHTKTYNSCRRKRSLLRMTFWSRCLIALFLHIGCLAVDHRHRNSELPYEEDELRLILGQSFPSAKLLEDEIDVNNNERMDLLGNGILSFYPFSLDFKESPVGMPKLGVVRIDNLLHDENLKLISISGSTVHFHSSFFADKTISPGSNTTFEIVFLSRVEGAVESDLFIHTSKGLFKYQVRGFGLPNPYRLKPLVGARIPVNGSYEPLITMHNPHGRRIQVVEMLSSGSDFHLSLPDEPDDGEEEAWAIEPFQTKSVMKGTFQGKAEGNHTGYIKIRVNSTKTASEYLLVPVEVTVSSSPGIYSPQESLDFGLLVKDDKPKTLSLSLINAQELPIHVQSVSVKGDPNSALRIEFRPISIEPDSTASTVIALVTFDPTQVSSPNDSHGFLEIRSENGDSISVPFRARVLHGELQYNTSSLGFFIEADGFQPRNFSIRNTFPGTVAIYEVSTSHPDVLQIKNYNGNGTTLLHSGQQIPIFELSVGKRGELCDPRTEIQLNLKSNVTNLKLPVVCYDGKLQMYGVEGNSLKFGSVEIHSSKFEYFSVGNSNPVEIRLKSWGSNTSWAHVELVGMKKGPKEDLVKIQDFDSLKKSLFLQPGYLAIFSVEIRRLSTEGVFWGESFVTTDHNQTLRVPFSAILSKGYIHSDNIHFDKAFPGKISLEKIHVSSNYNSSLGLRNIKGSPFGVPIWFTPISSTDLDIPPHRKICVGKIHFDPKEFCKDECYSGFMLDTPMGMNWVEGSDLNWNTGKLDWEILKELQRRFETVKDSTISNMTLWLESNTGIEWKIGTSISYVWPRVAPSKVIVFPLTAVGNESVVDVLIQNPTSSPLFVQALLANDYGPEWSQFVIGNGVGGNITEGNTVFSVSGLGSDSSQSDDKTLLFREVQRSIVMDLLNIKLGVKAELGATFLLPPSAKFYLRCRFSPISKQLASTLLLIRNNLTGIETTWLKGRAGTGLLTLGSGTPGSSLLFQITEKLLQGCENQPASKYLPPQLTVRRSFVARNIGDIPLDITIVEIYPPQGYYWPGSFSLKQGDSCEGFGFRILNCSPFTLQPNETHSIDIAYTPDFTMSRMIRSLRLTDSKGMHYNYTLVAMIPSGMLSVCATLITRPTWEPLLKYILIAIVLCGFVAASFLSYFEMNSIVSQAVVATVRVFPRDGGQMERDEGRTKLDLKSVYEKVDNRFKRIQQELASSNSASAGSSTKPTPPPPPSVLAPVQSQSNSLTNQSKFEVTTTVRNRKKTSISTGKASTNFIADIQPEPAKTSHRKGSKEDNNNSIASADEPKNTNTDDAKGRKQRKSGKGKWAKKPDKPQRTCSVTAIKNSHPEEETSSTTTESSNGGDDVRTNLLGLMNESPVSITTNEPKSSNKENIGNFEKKKKERHGGKRHLATPPLEQVTGRTDSSSSSWTNCGSLSENKKRNPQKQKQLSGSSSSGSRGSGSPTELGSPYPWEVFKNNANEDGTTNINSGRTFPTRRISSLWSDVPPNTGPGLLSSPPPGFTQQHHSLLSQPIPSYSHYQPQQPARFINQTGGNSSRRPGVIGQHRTSPANNLSTQSTGIANSILTTLGLTMCTNSIATSRSHQPAARTPSWNSDIKNDEWTHGKKRDMYGNGSSFAYGGNGSSTSSPPPGMSTNDIYNYSSALSSDLISSLWEMNSFDPSSQSQYNRNSLPTIPPPIASTSVSGIPSSTSSGTSMTSLPQSRGFLSRMRSDPSSLQTRLSQNTMQSQWPATSTSGSNASYYPTNHGTTRFESNGRDGSPALFGNGTNTNDPNLSGNWPNDVCDRSDWGNRQQIPPLDEVWNEPPCGYWTPVSRPSESERLPQNNFMQQNPNPRIDPPTSATNTTIQHASGIALQSQREIEAGLGFNPFWSNIWEDQDPSASSGWTPHSTR